MGDGRLSNLISSKVYVEDSNGMGDGMLSSAIDIYVPASWNLPVVFFCSIKFFKLHWVHGWISPCLIGTWFVHFLGESKCQRGVRKLEHGR